MLLEHRAATTAKESFYGRTALHAAAINVITINGHARVVEVVLLRAGADRHAENKYGKTPRETALFFKAGQWKECAAPLA